MICDISDSEFARLPYAEQLRKLFNEHRQWCIRYAKRKFPYLWDYVRQVTHLIDDPYFTDRTRLMWALTGRTSFPKCSRCGREIRLNTADGSYKPMCGTCNIQIAAQSEVRNQKLRDAQRKAVEADPDVYRKRSDKGKATKKANHGDPNWNNREKSVSTFKRHCTENPDFLREIQEREKARNNEKYGADWYVQTGEFAEKSARTCLENWGVDRYSKSSGHRDACIKTNNSEFGTDWYSQTDEYKKRIREKASCTAEKQTQTKRKNGTFITSKPENAVYGELCMVYGIENVCRNYRSDRRYPFACDFYIKPKDIFIECNFHWTHGGHWFDADSENDAAKLREWRQKSDVRRTASNRMNFYDVAIDVWTRRDVLKRNTAKANCLNYVVLWNMSDFYRWLGNQSGKAV